ncbi:hypothetical protein Tco_0323735 [Tanacetum coccineum]
MISRIVGALVEPTPVAVEADADSLAIEGNLVLLWIVFFCLGLWILMIVHVDDEMVCHNRLSTVASIAIHVLQVCKETVSKFTGLAKSGIIFRMRDMLEEAKSYAQPSSVMEKKDFFRSAYKKVVTQMADAATATTFPAQQKDNAAPTCHTPDVLKQP